MDRAHKFTSITANDDGLRNAASRKIDHIALPSEYNCQERNERRSIASCYPD